MDVTLEFTDDDLLADFARIRAAAIDMTPLMDDIGALLEQSARTRIEDTNESPDGIPWPKSYRVILGQGGKTLLDSGRLRDSLTHRAAPTEAQIGTNMISAAVHQFGATIKPKTASKLAFTLADGTSVVAGEVTIPARPYLGISATDETIIVRDLVPLHFLEGGRDG